jgi:hypothetical protein
VPLPPITSFDSLTDIIPEGLADEVVIVGNQQPQTTTQADDAPTT